MVSLTPAPSVPGPKEGSEAGCNQEVCRPPPSSAQPSPALPCRCGACYRQIGFIHGHAGRGAAGPALPEHAHTRVGDLHATITTHDARARTGSAGGGVMAQPGSWFWFKRKKNVLGVDVGVRWRALAGDARRPFREPLSGGGGEPSLSCSLKTHRTCYNRADTRRDGARKGQHTCCEARSLGRSPSPVHAPGLDAGGKDRQVDSNTGSEEAPRSEGRSRVLRGRGRRTALALGGGAGDREGIVLLVGGRPGPLRLWLILLILLLHQRDGG